MPVVQGAKCVLNKENPENSICPNFSTFLQFWAKDLVPRLPDTYSIEDKRRLARSLSESATLRGKFCYESEPLTSIEFYNCIVDIMHLFARVTDKLEDNLIDSILQTGILIVLIG